MSLIDSLRTFLDGATPEERAQREETRRQLKADFEQELTKAEQDLRKHDHWQRPENSLFPENIDRGPEVDAYRARLVSRIEHYREELRHLG